MDYSAHIKNYVFPEPDPLTELLIMSGDIGNPCQENYEQYIARQSKRFKKVFVLAGNHEYYTLADLKQKPRSILDTEKLIQKICSKYKNVFYLGFKIYELDQQFMIAGCTLWSNIDNQILQYQINDYNHIYIEDEPKKKKLRMINIKDTNNLHAQSLDFIKSCKEEAKKKKKRLLLFTHHAPTFRNTVGDGFKKHMMQMAGDNLESIMDETIAVWGCRRMAPLAPPASPTLESTPQGTPATSFI